MGVAAEKHARSEVLNDPASFAPIRGLREPDVQFRLKTEGYNELPRSERRTPLRIILGGLA